MYRYKCRILFIFFILAITKVGIAQDRTENIGDSFFVKKKEQLNQDPLSPPDNKPNNEIGSSYFDMNGRTLQNISQLGAAVEEHQRFTIFYAFFNQYLKNHIYYELRAYSLYHYISRLPPAPPLVPEVIPVSSERHPVGFGGVGIVGYQFDINSRVSLLPYIRLQDVTNSFVAYEDTFGNKLSSDNYSAFLGGKLSMKVNEQFAVYVNYYAGYLYSVLSGKGVFYNQTKSKVNSRLSVLEFGCPYQITKKLNITPYIQMQVLAIHSNHVTSDARYNINELTNTNNVYAVKIGYQF